MKIGSLIILLFITFSSCDCLQHIHGTVIDFETQLPIDDVMIIKDSNFIIHTDSLGKFEFTSITGGLFGCPKILLSFEKNGYNKTTKKYKSCCTDNNIVILKKNE